MPSRRKAIFFAIQARGGAFFGLHAQWLPWRPPIFSNGTGRRTVR